MIELSESLLRTIQEEAESRYPNECCGILIGTFRGDTKKVEMLLPAENNYSREEQYHRYWITPEEYRRRREIFDREVTALKREGHTPYVIPEGASNALGTWGYIRAAEELKKDIAPLPRGKTQEVTLLNASGSGGTTSGLILGARLHGLKARVVTVNVCDDRDTFIKAIGDICEEAISTYKLGISFSRDRDIEIIDGYVGRGYALSRPEELHLLLELARSEGIFLDPVYTGKAFYGLTQELKKNPAAFGKRIVFLHTGGIFDLFARTTELTSIL